MLIPILLLCVLFPASIALAQGPDSGRQIFVSRCASCHGSDGNGGELGPAIAARVPSRTDEDLRSLFRQGLPAAGMPAFPSLSDAETGALVRYVRTLRPRTGSGPVRTKITLIDGGLFEGLVVTDSHPRAVALRETWSSFLEVDSTATLLTEHLISNR